MPRSAALAPAPPAQVIAADLEKKHADLLASYAADLKDVADIFHAFRDRPVRRGGGGGRAGGGVEYPGRQRARHAGKRGRGWGVRRAWDAGRR